MAPFHFVLFLSGVATLAIVVLYPAVHALLTLSAAL